MTPPPRTPEQNAARVEINTVLLDDYVEISGLLDEIRKILEEGLQELNKYEGKLQDGDYMSLDNYLDFFFLRHIKSLQSDTKRMISSMNEFNANDGE